MTLLFKTRSFQALWLATAVATLVLGYTLFRFVPLHVDGGWYTYPSLALYEGRDPGDNQHTEQELLREPPGRKARFFWDSRRNLYVLPTFAWFRAAGASWLSLRYYGLLQLVVLWAVAWGTFRRFGGSPLVSTSCWLLFCSDAVFLSNGLTDGRPDLLLTTVALALFVSVVRCAHDNRLGVPFACGLLLAVLLPLLHLTSLVTMAIMAAFVVLGVAVRWPLRSKGIVGAFVLLATAFIVFLLRTFILDRILPSAVAESYAQDPWEMLRLKASMGVGGVLAVEGLRWFRYLWPSNWMELALILAGFIGSFRVKGTTGEVPARALFVACIGGCCVVALCSPSPRIDHLMSVMPFLLLASSSVISELALAADIVTPLLGVLVLVGAGLTSVPAGYVVYRYGSKAGMDNEQVEQLFRRVLAGPRELTRIVGPSEIWPYFPPATNAVIDDNRVTLYDFSGDRWRNVDYVVLNRDYMAYQWVERFEKRYPELTLEEVDYVGERNKSLFVGVYRVVRRESEGGLGEAPAAATCFR